MEYNMNILIMACYMTHTCLLKNKNDSKPKGKHPKGRKDQDREIRL